MGLKARFYTGLAVLVAAGVLLSMAGVGLNWPSTDDRPQRLPGCDRNGEHHVTLRVRLNVFGPVEVFWEAGLNKGDTTVRNRLNWDTASVVPCGTTLKLDAVRESDGQKVQCEILADSVRVRFQPERLGNCHLWVKLP